MRHGTRQFERSDSLFLTLLDSVVLISPISHFISAPYFAQVIQVSTLAARCQSVLYIFLLLKCDWLSFVHIVSLRLVFF